MSWCHSASAETPPPPPRCHLYPLSLCTVCPSHCPALIVTCWIYTDANSTVGCVCWCAAFGSWSTETSLLPPSYHPQHQGPPSPVLLPPTLCPAPHLGWPGCCSEGSSHPRSCQRPPSFPWAEHTIEKGLRLRGSVAINPYQLFLPRVFCATIRAPEGALTSTNLAIVGQECWQKKRNFSCVHASVCIHVWEPRNVGLISIVACEEGRPWRIPYLAAWQNSFA